MNNFYYGIWIFGYFKGMLEEMYYVGQDICLYIFVLNEVDKWVYFLLKYQDKWWLKNGFNLFSKKVVILIFKVLGWEKINSRIFWNFYKVMYIFDLKKYINKFYFKIDKQKIKDKGLFIDYYEKIICFLDLDIDKCLSSRVFYNEIVWLKWSE